MGGSLFPEVGLCASCSSSSFIWPLNFPISSLWKETENKDLDVIEETETAQNDLLSKKLFEEKYKRKTFRGKIQCKPSFYGVNLIFLHNQDEKIVFRKKWISISDFLDIFELFVILARVDVSETFSADQLWFRIITGLFQRCSLPENLWTALISSEQRWFLTDLEELLANFSKICRNTAILRHTNQIFHPILRIEVSNKNLDVQFLTGQIYNNNSKVSVFCYCLSNKTDMVQFCKSFFPFSRMNFQNYFKKFEFLLSFYRIMGKIYIFWIRAMPF